MVQNRVIPCLLTIDGQLVKTAKFKNPAYVGDPVNAIKIFNKKEVDEIIVLDISNDRFKNGPKLDFIQHLTNECFMPLSYGGGITQVQQIRAILKTGVEKVIINSSLQKNLSLIRHASNLFGSQCIIASVDVKKHWTGQYRPFFKSGTSNQRVDLKTYLSALEQAGAGEVILHNISREGSWSGFDLELLRLASSTVRIPVIALGGAGNINHIKEAITHGGVSAVAIGSMSVYQKKGKGRLINFPDQATLQQINHLKYS